MTAGGRVSVIIPVFNGELYLAEALESVLAQTHRPFEIIVVDDGSTDGTAAVAQRFGAAVRYDPRPNGGAAAARNRGIELAAGDFLAFLDADDVWVDDKLANQMQAFADDPALEIVFGEVQQFLSPELPEDTRRQIKIPVERSAGKHVGAMLIRAEAFRKVGPFRSDWKVGEFIDWYARAEEHGLETRTLPSVVMRRRLHKASQGTYQRQHRADYVRVLKAALDRRRRSEPHDE